MENDKLYKCEFCTKTFVHEKRFLAHMCLRKQRWLNRDEKFVKVGFTAYRRFHEISYRRASPPEFDRFMQSKMYNAFVSFGRYLLHINAINPESFIDFLVKAQIPIDHWEKPIVYENYVRELTKKESVSDAAFRNILLMEQWGNRTGERWQDFFRKITAEQATEYIRSGRISPWVLYTAASADELFQRLSPEQAEMIQGYIDVGFWSIMLQRHDEDRRWLAKQLEDEGV